MTYPLVIAKKIQRKTLWFFARPFVWKGLSLIALVGGVLNVSGIVFLGYFTQLPHIYRDENLDGDSVYSRDMLEPSDSDHFKKVLAPLISDSSTDEQRALAVMKWLLNEVPARGAASRALSSWKMLAEGRKGVGLACSQMAQIYRDAMLSLGVPARRVILKRNVFDIYDSHVAVEVWWDGSWHLLDPTYNLGFRREGRLVGLKDVRAWWILGRGTPIANEHFEKRLYSARLDQIPFRYEAFFNNVYVETYRSFGYKRLIPVAGAWIGPQWAYSADGSGASTMHQEAYRVLYYFFMLVLPVSSLLASILALCLFKARGKLSAVW